jgi:hypothetical protein
MAGVLKEPYTKLLAFGKAERSFGEVRYEEATWF